MSEFSTRRIMAGKVLLSAMEVLNVRDMARALDKVLPGVHYAKSNEDHKVALTIDDVPSSATTCILETLRRHQAHGTFFVTTGRIPGREGILERLVHEGHELGNHMVDDTPSYSLTEKGFTEQLHEAHRALERYQVPRWFRPASGVYSRRIIEEARKLGYSIALGDVFPFDTHVPSPERCARYINSHTRGGSIIILHDGEERGVRAAATLDLVLPALQQRELEIVTLSSLLM